MKADIISVPKFESFVNSEEYQTERYVLMVELQFESFVNSEEYQTRHLRD